MTSEKWFLLGNAPRRGLMLKSCLFFLFWIVASVVTISAQELPPRESTMPEEYDPSEFPLWMQDLRRFEVVTVGTFPVTYLFVSLIYDFSIYAANNFKTQYSIGSQRDSRDIGIIVGSAGAASFILATVDLFINLNKRAPQDPVEDD